MRRSNWKNVFAATVVAAAVLSAAPELSAHQNDDGETTVFAVGSLGAPTTTSTMLELTVVGGGISTGLVLLRGLTDLLDAASTVARARETYVRNNAVELQQDLTLGGGESIRELAVVFDVDRGNYETFASVLHDRRETLIPLTRREDLDRRRAARFFREVARGVRGHPELRGNLRRTEAVANLKERSSNSEQGR